MVETKPDVAIVLRDGHGTEIERIVLVVAAGPATPEVRASLEAQLARVAELLKGYQSMTPVVFMKNPTDPDTVVWKQDGVEFTYRASEHTYNLDVPGESMSAKLASDVENCLLASVEPRAWVGTSPNGGTAFWVMLTFDGPRCELTGSRFELMGR